MRALGLACVSKDIRCPSRRYLPASAGGAKDLSRSSSAIFLALGQIALRTQGAACHRQTTCHQAWAKFNLYLRSLRKGDLCHKADRPFGQAPECCDGDVTPPDHIKGSDPRRLRLSARQRNPGRGKFWIFAASAPSFAQASHLLFCARRGKDPCAEIGVPSWGSLSFPDARDGTRPCTRNARPLSDRRAHGHVWGTQTVKGKRFRGRPGAAFFIISFLLILGPFWQTGQRTNEAGGGGLAGKKHIPALATPTRGSNCGKTLVPATGQTGFNAFRGPYRRKNTSPDASMGPVGIAGGWGPVRYMPARCSASGALRALSCP